MNAVTATVLSTGEVLFFEADTPDQLLESYETLNQYIKTLEGLKKKLQRRAQELTDEYGPLSNDKYAIRISNVQRMNYTKESLRQVFDEDELDLFLEPSKTKVDNYIKDHLEELGPASTLLRASMELSGKPYTVVKLERLTADHELTERAA